METSKWANEPAKDTPKTTFTLNPAAPEYSFTPSPAPTPQQAFTPQSYPDEDEFASQTRAQDDLDLFDDDFEPIQDVLLPQQPVTSGGRGGRGRGGRGRGGLQEPTARPTTYTDVRLEASSTNTPSTSNIDSPTTTTDTNPNPPTTNETTSEPTPPRPRIEAVRGDRSKTGGLPKTKLTEAQLTERMAQMKLKNATRVADHERAAADEASFREREIQAQFKRAEEFRNRQQMDKEREKNAQRKLKAMQGREWEKEKNVVEERDGRRSQFRRGAYGGVASGSRTPASEDAATAGWGESTNADAEGWTSSIPPPLEAGEASTRPDLFGDRQRDEYRGGGRGRGGKGRGGFEGRGGGYEGRGRGRGRGSGYEGGRGSGRGSGGGSNTPSDRFSATTEDFPALGSASTKNNNSGSSAWGASTSTKATDVPTATKPEWDKPTPSGDWAEEMAQPGDADSTEKW